MEIKATKELNLGIGDFNAHGGKKMDRFESVHRRNGIGKRKKEDRMLLEFCDLEDLCVASTLFKKKEKRKVTYSSGGNETDIDFVLVKKESRKFFKDVKMIPWELQHRLVFVDVKKENLFKCLKTSVNAHKIKGETYQILIGQFIVYFYANKVE